MLNGGHRWPIEAVSQTGREEKWIKYYIHYETVRHKIVALQERLQCLSSSRNSQVCL